MLAQAPCNILSEWVSLLEWEFKVYWRQWLSLLTVVPSESIKTWVLQTRRVCGHHLKYCSGSKKCPQFRVLFSCFFWHNSFLWPALSLQELARIGQQKTNGFRRLQYNSHLTVNVCHWSSFQGRNQYSFVLFCVFDKMRRYRMGLKLQIQPSHLQKQ